GTAGRSSARTRTERRLRRLLSSIRVPTPPRRSSIPRDSLDAREDVGPLLQHFWVTVSDMDREMRVTGAAQFTAALLLDRRSFRERQGLDQVRGADLLLFRTEEHQMAAVVFQISRVPRLVFLVDRAIALQQRHERRWDRAPHVPELLDLDQVVKRDRRVRPG